MAHPDIIDNPTELLDGLPVAEDSAAGWTQAQMIDAANIIWRLDKHLRAGGKLPAQWRDEGTAVGKLVKDAEENIGVFKNVAEDGGPDMPMWLENADMTMEAIESVTGGA